MFTEGFDQLFRINRSANAPLNDFTRLTTELCRRAAQQNLEIMGENILLLSDQLKKLSMARRPEDFITLQKNCMNEGISVGLETVQKLLNASVDNFNTLTTLYGTLKAPLQTAAHTMKKTADEVTEAMRPTMHAATTRKTSKRKTTLKKNGSTKKKVKRTR